MTLHQRLALLLGISLLFSFFSWGRKILFPIQIFTTWIHECCHAFTAMVLGAEAIHITLSPDGSGLTHFKIPKGKVRHAIIASAGYLGTSLVGCLMFLLLLNTEKPNPILNIQSVIFIFSGIIGFSLLFWIRNLFGFISVLLLGGALASLTYPPLKPFAHEILLFLSIQTALNSLFDIRTLLALDSKKSNQSDAHTLQKLFYLPHWVWAISWLSMSLLLMFKTSQFVN
jgi:hypothetical protein